MTDKAQRDPLEDIDRVILALNDWRSLYAHRTEVSDKALRAVQLRIGKTGALAYSTDALESAQAVRERLLAMKGTK